jgi:serine/threonine protein kinase
MAGRCCALHGCGPCHDLAQQASAGARRKVRIRYGPEVDVWSAGCIFAELLTGVPLFGRDDEIDALYAICQTCGSPDPAEWPEVTQLAGWESCRKDFKVNKLRQTLAQRMYSKRRARSRLAAAAFAVPPCQVLTHIATSSVCTAV